LEQRYLGQGTAVTPAMGKALERWQRSFYGLNTPRGGHPTGLAAALTGYLATLVTSELSLRVTGGKRAVYLEQTVRRFLPMLQRAVQLAAAEGQSILRPRLQDGELLVELIPASRFYPIRFDAAGRPTAGYFADFRTSGRDELVRLESFDLRGGTLTLKNTAYRLKGDKLEREISLDAMDCWRDLEPEVVVDTTVVDQLMCLINLPEVEVQVTFLVIQVQLQLHQQIIYHQEVEQMMLHVVMEQQTTYVLYITQIMYLKIQQ